MKYRESSNYIKMANINIPPEAREVIQDVIDKISQNLCGTIEELWNNWTQMGVRYDERVHNISKILQIERELHNDMLYETRQSLKNMKIDVQKLQEEVRTLAQLLNDIPALQSQDETPLVEYKKNLEELIAGYKERVAQRRIRMQRLLEWQKDLSEALGITIEELDKELLASEEKCDKMEARLQILQNERDKRCETFQHGKLVIKDIMEKLQIQPRTKFENIVLNTSCTEFKVTDFNMDRIAKLQQDLQEEYEQTNNKVLELRETLTQLWECLEEDQQYRESFLQTHTGCHWQTEKAIREEIKRCDQIKLQKLSMVLNNTRNKISEMWDKCFYGPRQREEFYHFRQEDFNMDTLVVLEAYLDDIKIYYEQHRRVFEMLAERKTLWSSMCELEARASAPDRYHNRGGKLLHEEKERKLVSVKLAKIEAQLKELVTNYMAETGKDFMVEDKSLLQCINDDWENRKLDRQNKLSARKQALTPNFVHNTLTPHFAHTDNGKRDRAAAGLPLSCTRLPAKRKIIPASADKATAKATASTTNLTMKRTAISTVKRRVSGRLVAKGVNSNNTPVKRKLNYEQNKTSAKPPTVTVTILKHKRSSLSKRRSMRKSRSSTDTHNSQNNFRVNEPTNGPEGQVDLSTYSVFQTIINDKTTCRSSMNPAEELKSRGKSPNDKFFLNTQSKPHMTPLAQKGGKENQNYHSNNTPVDPLKSYKAIQPGNDVFLTPIRLTRSASKTGRKAFDELTHSPLSANKILTKSKMHQRFVR